MELNKNKKEIGYTKKVLLIGGGMGQLQLARKLHDKGLNANLNPKLFNLPFISEIIFL